MSLGKLDILPLEIRYKVYKALTTCEIEIDITPRNHLVAAKSKFATQSTKTQRQNVNESPKFTTRLEQEVAALQAARLKASRDKLLSGGRKLTRDNQGGQLPVRRLHGILLPLIQTCSALRKEILQWQSCPNNLCISPAMRPIAYNPQSTYFLVDLSEFSPPDADDRTFLITTFKFFEQFSRATPRAEILNLVFIPSINIDWTNKMQDAQARFTVLAQTLNTAFKSVTHLELILSEERHTPHEVRIWSVMLREYLKENTDHNVTTACIYFESSSVIERPWRSNRTAKWTSADSPRPLLLHNTLANRSAIPPEWRRDPESIDPWTFDLRPFLKEEINLRGSGRLVREVDMDKLEEFMYALDARRLDTRINPPRGQDDYKTLARNFFGRIQPKIMRRAVMVQMGFWSWWH